MTPTLLLGDCLQRLAEIAPGSVDLILTDPPYGRTACKWDNVIPFKPMWNLIWRVLKPNGACLLFGSEPFASTLRVSQIEKFKYDWVWVKNAGSNFALVKWQPMKEHETISVFYNKMGTYNPQKQLRSENGIKMVKASIKSKPKASTVYGSANSQGYDSGKVDPIYRGPSSVQHFKRERGLHPTQKPVSLLEYLIKTYTLEGETVLDFTMGSGSTGVACVNTNRKFIGIEKDEHYFEIAKSRILQE
jgi:site-specific DNA-methyltransferase (adenine-specific)